MAVVADLTDRLRDAPLVGVLGPTASGKSALALDLAERLGGEILAVDSMTVYRGMDLGTAKPTAGERSRVVHHGLDLAEPTDGYTVARFVALADSVIADAARRGVPLVAVGGTPMYWKAMLEGLFDGPPRDAAYRAELDALPADDLRARLEAVDPEAAGRIHRNDRRRATRALEVFHLTGQPISDQQTQWDKAHRRHDFRLVGMRGEREALNSRINSRTRQMIAAGWVDEVRGLLDRHGSLSGNALDAAGYRLLVDHLRGRLPLDDAVEQIKIATRQLAKRQVRWFRTFADVEWLDPSATVAVE